MKLNLRNRHRHTQQKHNWLTATITGAACLSVLLLWVCAASVYIRPSVFHGIGVFGLAFPLLLGGVLCTLLLTLLVAPRRSWIPIAGLVACSGSIRSFFPINFPKTAPDGSLKVLTWNVQGWGLYPDNYTLDKKHNLVAKYLGESQADIICAQETFVNEGFHEKYLYPELTRTPYRDSIIMVENSMSIYSRFPLLGRKVICDDSLNGAVAWWILLAPNDTLITINCHLTGMGLGYYKPTVQKGNSGLIPDGPIARNTFKQLVQKIDRATIKRADMADSIAFFLQQHSNKSIIVCGDFNDTPISYTHKTISRHLIDAYRATATGLGRSLNQDGIVVRIDNILCSRDWTPYECRVDGDINYSDHNPVMCYLKRTEP